MEVPDIELTENERALLQHITFDWDVRKHDP